jgi:carbamoyltransferase
MATSSILGLSAYYHDSACCLLQDGAVTAAVQEERLSRRKHDPSLPVRSFRFCLEQGDVTIDELDCIAYYEQPVWKLDRQLQQFAGGRSKERLLKLWRRARQPFDEIRRVLGYEGDIACVQHHEAHAASAFHFSGAPEAAILTVDGVGEWATTTYGHGMGSSIDLFEEVRFPHSIGLLYSAMTSYLGFTVNDGEYKVMGLAPYGTPRYVREVERLIRLGDRGAFELDLTYFDFTRPDRMYSGALQELFRRPGRTRAEPFDDFHKDVARSVQAVLEEILLTKVRYLHQVVPVDTLCLAGGVALNCVANGRIRREGPFKELFVQPAAGDAGGCLGAAAIVHARRAGGTGLRRLESAYLGPAYSSGQVRQLLDGAGVGYRRHTEEASLVADAAARLSRGDAIAWFQGRMEFGPRALGARSILADPRDPTMRDRLNLMVKKRESFRPFAPAVLRQCVSDHFELSEPSPFMLHTCRTRSAIDLPAITHVDGSARVQTVDAETAPRFAALLAAFNERTGCPILLNTSFNLQNEAIVCSPADALLSFARSQLDALVLEDCIVERRDLTPAFIASCGDGSDVKLAPCDHVYTFS